MESKYPVLSIYRDDDSVAIEFLSGFAEMSDYKKLETLNTAIELLMDKSGIIITSLEVQRTSQAGQQKLQ